MNNVDYEGYINLNALKRESWVVRAVLKYIPNVSKTIISKVIFSTPKWIGAYIELNVGYGYQSNPQGLISFGFSKWSFDVGISLGTGRLGTAIAVGVSWSEIYLQCSVIYSAKNTRMFFAINFKFAVKHWFSLAVGALCYAVPILVPVAKTALKALFMSKRTVKPVLLYMLPIILKV